jgi:hypothetical protein
LLTSRLNACLTHPRWKSRAGNSSTHIRRNSSSLAANAVVRAAQIRKQKRARVQSEINKLHICSSLCARRSDNFSSERLNDALLSSQNKIKLQHRHTVCAKRTEHADSRARGRRGKSGNSFELFRDSTIKAVGAVRSRRPTWQYNNEQPPAFSLNAPANAIISKDCTPAKGSSLCFIADGRPLPFGCFDAVPNTFIVAAEPAACSSEFSPKGEQRKGDDFIRKLLTQPQ